MTIKASSARQIEALIADLSSVRTLVREAAIARLTVAGARAVDRLLGVLDAAVPPDARVGALRVLEAIGDVRTLDRVLEQVDAPESAVATAAVLAVRGFLAGERGALVIDRLTRTVLDRTREDAVRVAALQALGDLQPATLAPLLAALEHEPSDALRAAARPGPGPAAIIQEAAERGLPDDPSELIDALARAGTSVPAPLLLLIVERVRDRERTEPDEQRAQWTRARGRAHVALTHGGSRLGLYDLRESFEAASSPLPVEFLAALQAAGDASCLEATAAAYARSVPGDTTGTGGELWWHDRLGDVFLTIVSREQLTRRHRIMKKIAKRWGTALDGLWSIGLRKPGLELSRTVAPHARTGGRRR